MSKIEWEIPLETVSEANCSQHWRKKYLRHKKQQIFIRLAYNKYVKNITFPCEVTMIRLAPRTLDEDDNLRMAFKWIKDEISECLLPEKQGSYLNKKGNTVKIKGRADSDPRIKWKYAQEPCTQLRVRIEIDF